MTTALVPEPTFAGNPGRDAHFCYEECRILILGELLSDRPQRKDFTHGLGSNDEWNHRFWTQIGQAVMAKSRWGKIAPGEVANWGPGFSSTQEWRDGERPVGAMKRRIEDSVMRRRMFGSVLIGPRQGGSDCSSIS